MHKGFFTAKTRAPKNTRSSRTHVCGNVSFVRLEHYKSTPPIFKNKQCVYAGNPEELYLVYTVNSEFRRVEILGEFKTMYPNKTVDRDVLKKLEHLFKKKSFMCNRYDMILEEMFI